MECIEKIEKLKNKANVSYEDAKEALEKYNWDLLDSMVYLEQNGKIEKPSIEKYCTNEKKEYINKEINEIKEYKSTKKQGFFERFFEATCRIIDKGNRILFIIQRKEKLLMKLPITVMILLFIFAFWGIIPLLIIGLFFEMEYSLKGYNIENSSTNKFLKILPEYTEKIKNEFKKDKKND